MVKKAPKSKKAKNLRKTRIRLVSDKRKRRGTRRTGVNIRGGVSLIQERNQENQLSNQENQQNKKGNQSINHGNQNKQGSTRILRNQGNQNNQGNQGKRKETKYHPKNRKKYFLKKTPI